MTSEPSIQGLQELAHGKGYDYRSVSSHLRRPQLYDWFSDLLREELRYVTGRDRPTPVLEVGAGDGAFVESPMAAPCERHRHRDVAILD